jgi:molybdopterin-guanine dinucleotide biosynthesis protein A
MTGLVLCGGNSSRMGTDKGLLLVSGITWAETACSKLSNLIPAVTISVNAQQLPVYRSHFPDKTLIVDNPQLSVGGPLRGLLSVHLQLPKEDIFVFACDLLFMENIVFRNLLDKQQQSPAYEAYVFMNNQQAEPLCGVYTAKGLAKIFTAYHEGSLGKQSMKHVLEMLNTCYQPLPSAWQDYFKNINTRDELSHE